jgi:signal transduction histidine kinase
LPQIVADACALTRGYAAEKGTVVEFAQATLDIEIDGRVVELEQVLVNLIRNAIESKNRGARVSVKTWVDQDFAIFSVSDDGKGMTKEQKARVFEPFFTTRQTEGGTGLGMSIVHGIVAGHGGTIRIETKPQAGTTVVVCLPRHK